MKKILLYILLVVSLTSCQDFLEEKSQDLVIPRTVEHFKELVYGEMVDKTIDDCKHVMSVMSDNVTSYYQKKWGNTKEGRTNYWSYYTYQQVTEYNMKNELIEDKMYPELYRRIVLCNSILFQTEDFDKESSKVQQLLGEVHFLRAQYYFLLANLYSVPYISETASVNTPCVPLNEESGICMVQHKRATQKQIYDRIREDIKLAVRYFQNTSEPVTIYRPNLKAACILATRIFLTTKQYDKVIDYAEIAGNFETFYDIEAHINEHGTISASRSNSDSSYPNFINAKNDEIVYTYSDFFEQLMFVHFGRPGYAGVFLPSQELIDLYEVGDLRKKLFFDNRDRLMKQPFNIGGLAIKHGTFRTAEGFLNLAEALAHTDPDKAKQCLELLRENRFTGTPPALPDLDIKILVDNEKRKELCFEGLRWFDLRRNPKEIIHEFPLSDETNTEVYTLAADDAAYTLPLPISEISQNSDIKQHRRPERESVIIQNDE